MQHDEDDEEDEEEKKPGKDYDEDDEDEPADDDEDDDEEPLQVRPRLLPENCSDPFFPYSSDSDFSPFRSRTSVFIATSLRRRFASISPVTK